MRQRRGTEPLEWDTAAGVLVLGYQGTLACDAGSSSAEAAPCLPQVEPWVEAAQRELDSRTVSDALACRGECIRSTALAAGLRERLTGMAAQVLAADPETVPGNLVRQFPVLPDLFRTAAAEWVDAIVTFHRRFHRDAARMTRWLGVPQLPELASLTPAASDAHPGGHSVLRLVFRNGCAIYYKPRPITGEWLWDRLAQAVNSKSSLHLPSAASLPGSGGRYGWVAALTPDHRLQALDHSSAQAAAWWHGAGATLCLAAQSGMTDLHLANIMATGCGPAVLDAESFGTPHRAADLDGGKASAAERFIRRLQDTGLLPHRNAAGLPDVSGLFGCAAPVPQIQVPCWSATPDGTGRVRFVPSALRAHGNAPAGASPLAVLPWLVSGYREAAEALIRCRDELLAPGSEWRNTLERQHAPRIILRDTLSYALLVSQSLAPRHLRSAPRRRGALDEALHTRSQGSLPEAILRTECRNIAQLHIPRFAAMPGSRSLSTSSGRALARGFFSTTAAEVVLGGIGELSLQSLGDEQIPAVLLALLNSR